MNTEQEIQTIYRIKLPYTNGNNVEYFLYVKNNRFFYDKFIGEKKVESTKYGINRNRMVKNIYHILQNIKKLKRGKIKKYQIFSQLELEILCDYLKHQNIFHTIYITFGDFSDRYDLTYAKYKEKNIFYKSYFNNNMEYENCKIMRIYNLYIKVHKGFVL
jgi:hypothetical protein